MLIIKNGNPDAISGSAEVKPDTGWVGKEINCYMCGCVFKLEKSDGDKVAAQYSRLLSSNPFSCLYAHCPTRGRGVAIK